eukprot:jgi/Ulvmu1/9291/UM050_0040.1
MADQRTVVGNANRMMIAAGRLPTLSCIENVVSEISRTTLVIDSVQKGLNCNVCVPSKPPSIEATLVAVIQYLQDEVLQIDLSHISPLRVLEGCQLDIGNLTEIIAALVCLEWQPGVLSAIETVPVGARVAQVASLPQNGPVIAAAVPQKGPVTAVADAPNIYTDRAVHMGPSVEPRHWHPGPNLPSCQDEFVLVHSASFPSAALACSQSDFIEQPALGCKKMLTASSLIPSSDLSIPDCSMDADKPVPPCLLISDLIHKRDLSTGRVVTLEPNPGSDSVGTAACARRAHHGRNSGGDAAREHVSNPSGLCGRPPAGTIRSPHGSPWRGSSVVNSVQPKMPESPRQTTSRCFQLESVSQAEHREPAPTCDGRQAAQDHRGNKDACASQLNTRTGNLAAMKCFDHRRFEPYTHNENSSDAVRIACARSTFSQSKHPSSSHSQYYSSRGNTMHLGVSKTGFRSTGTDHPGAGKNAMLSEPPAPLPLVPSNMFKAAQSPSSRPDLCSVAQGTDASCSQSHRSHQFSDASGHSQPGSLEDCVSHADAGSGSASRCVNGSRSAASLALAQHDLHSGRDVKDPFEVSGHRKDHSVMVSQLDEDDAVLAAVIQDILGEEHVQESPILEAAPADGGAHRIRQSHGIRNQSYEDTLASRQLDGVQSSHLQGPKWECSACIPDQATREACEHGVALHAVLVHQCGVLCFLYAM